MEAADALLVRQLVDLEDLQVAGAQDGQNVLVAAVDRDREVLARGRDAGPAVGRVADEVLDRRSEEHTSELQSLMRISYAVFCLKKKKKKSNEYKTKIKSHTYRIHNIHKHHTQIVSLPSH